MVLIRVDRDWEGGSSPAEVREAGFGSPRPSAEATSGALTPSLRERWWGCLCSGSVGTKQGPLPKFRLPAPCSQTTGTLDIPRMGHTFGNVSSTVKTSWWHRWVYCPSWGSVCASSVALQHSQCEFCVGPAASGTSGTAELGVGPRCWGRGPLSLQWGCASPLGPRHGAHVIPEV